MRRLFVVSAWTLLLEMLLIRWLSSEVRIFSYVSNLALLATFLGVGFGCHLSRPKPRLVLTLLSLALLVTAVKAPGVLGFDGRQLLPVEDITRGLGHFSDAWVGVKSLGTASLSRELLATGMGVFATLCVFGLALGAMIPLGQLLGHGLQTAPQPLRAYAVNLLGSLAGIWGFYLLSWCQTPPWLWFLGVGLGILGLAPRSWRDGLLGVALLGITLLGVIPQPSATKEVWSPYHKLAVFPLYTRDHQLLRGYGLQVNTRTSSGFLNLSEAFMRHHPQDFDLRAWRQSGYNIPSELAASLDRVLVIGSGGGNDVASALRHGAAHIDAVDIDPMMMTLSNRYHPEHPYQDPRVRIFITDGRAFVKRAHDRYDLIEVSRVYSHVLSSSQQLLRLDDYLYTRESFQELKRLLKDDGLLVVYFYVVRPWTGERLSRTLDTVFGFPPVAFEVPWPHEYYGGGGVLFLTGATPATVPQLLARHPDIAELATQHRTLYRGAPKVPTDDWPYFYLENPRLPTLHLLILIPLGLLFLLGQRRILRPHHEMHWGCFFLGAGFLLLEVHNVSKLGLLFGNTWAVAAIGVSGILLLTLAANGVLMRMPIPRLAWRFGAIVLALAMPYLIPLNTLNALAFWPRLVISGGLVNLPVFFAGLIFPTVWHQSPRRDWAFGSNVLGAAFGGCLEPLSFVIGIRHLLVVVAVLYGCAYLNLRRAGGH